MILLCLQVLSFSVAVVGKWHITSTCQTKRRRGFGLVVCSGLLFNSLIFYSGLHFSALAGLVLLCIDFRGFIHNGT